MAVVPARWVTSEALGDDGAARLMEASSAYVWPFGKAKSGRWAATEGQPP